MYVVRQVIKIMASIEGSVHVFLILYLSIGFLKTVYVSASSDKQYVPLLNKVKTPVMAELDLSNLGEQLKSFMQNEIKNVITEKLVLESKDIQYKLESKINKAIEEFRTSMDTYTNDVLRNNSILMQKTIERKLNKSLSRRVRRFRNIMNSDIRSTLQHVKNEIDAVLSENYNSSNFKNPDGTRIGKLSGKIIRLSEHLKGKQICNFTQLNFSVS